jgi:uncharacterized protein YwqG
MMKFFRLIRRVLFYNDYVMFLRNAWAFRKELAYFRPYDHGYNMEIFCRSLVLTRDFLESDKALSEPAKEYAEQITDFLENIDRHNNAAEIAEKELGYTFSYLLSRRTEEQKESDRILIDKVQEIEQTSWNDAMDNLKKNFLCWWD